MAGTWLRAARTLWQRAGRARRGLRRWRRGRPFWGGLFAIAGGLEILLLPLMPVPLLVQVGVAGVSRLLMGILMVVMGVAMWVAPHYRAFAGIATILFSLTSFVTSNLGGFLLGMLLGIVGGALGFAWAPVPPPRAEQPEQPEQPDQPDRSEQPEQPEQTDRREQPRQPRQPDRSPEVAGAGEGGAARGPAALPLLLVLVAVPLGLFGHPPRPAAALPAPDTASAAPAADAAPAPPAGAAVPAMSARSVDMTGLTFDGVIRVETVSGSLRVLKFSMDGVVMRGYRLDGSAAGGPGLTAGVLTLNGAVSFYTTRLSGLVGGAVAVEYTPDLPPELVPPELTFTRFRSEQVYVRTDRLAVTGLDLRVQQA